MPGVHRGKAITRQAILRHGFTHGVQFTYAGQIDALKGFAFDVGFFLTVVGVGRVELDDMLGGVALGLGVQAQQDRRLPPA